MWFGAFCGRTRGAYTLPDLNLTPLRSIETLAMSQGPLTDLTNTDVRAVYRQESLDRYVPQYRGDN